MQSSQFQQAVAELRNVLGSEHVLVDRAAIAEYEQATFSTSQRISLVVLPGSRAEVQAIVRIANNHALRLYPVSRGRNWGLGSRVPVQTDSCVLDLHRMDRIVDFDPCNATLTVEPGVTFLQVSSFLRSHGSDLYLPATGGPPDSSVLANALERGDGVGPAGDRARYCAGFEVVLPTGECVPTGLGAYHGSLAGGIAQSSVGPGIEGLFFQSNLGIVTRMSVLLARRPRHFQVLAFAAEDERQLIDATAAVRELQQRGVVQDTSYSLWNIYRFLTAQGPYPWSATGGKVVAPRQLLETLPRIWQNIRWVGFVGIYSASAAHALANRWLVRRVFGRKLSRYFLLDGVVAGLGRLLHAPLRRLTGVDVRRFLDALYYESVFVGQPTKLETSSIYWRKRDRTHTTGNPDHDRCGLHWICVALPFDGQHIARCTAIVEQTAEHHGLEPMCMFFAMNQWYLRSFIVLMFDQDVDGENEAASRCHDDLLNALVEAGYPPVRLGIQSMSIGAPTDPTYIDVIARIKRTLDPNDILAPGRYDFRESWTGAGSSE